jgi:hypothetical protein
MSTEYLDIRAMRMGSGKSAACRRAIDKHLVEVKSRLAQGQYGAENEPLEDLENLVGRDPACIKRGKPSHKTTPRKRNTKNRSK